MSKFKIINLIDKLFVTVCAFLIIFAWINFYIRNLWTSFILSTIFSISCVYILYFFLDKKHTKANLKKESLTKINDNFLYFCLLPHDKKLSLLYEILSQEFPTELKKNFLIYKKDNKSHIVILATQYQRLDQYTLVNIVAELSDKNYDHIDVICNEYDNKLNTQILNNLEINIIDKTKLYTDFFLKSNIYPNNENVSNSINKIKLKDIIQNIFAPHKSKSYFFCGLILIFSSLILPYNRYYIVVGSMLLLFSIICKIYPKIKP